jgi:para-aminobenzoate synthetase component 1
MHGLKLAQFLIINDIFARMSLSPYHNFICRPHPVHADKLLISGLEPCADAAEAGFVVIPYRNPGKGLVRYSYYKVFGETEVSKPAYAENTQKHYFTPRTTKNRYLQHVQHIKEHIQLGNVYELNYCLEFFEDNTVIDVFDVFVKLMDATKAPYTYLLKLGDDVLICCSPELFLKRNGNVLYTKPIKGTIRRGVNAAEDEELKNTLQHSLKERTENVMAVDVARNDLSKIAVRGSVSVNKLYHIDTFETVHQMVSTVSCDVKPGVEMDAILQATFPMASMTGAPKGSAMDLIDASENFERLYYSGSFGLIDSLGNFELPVVIRSIYYRVDTGYLSLAAGGAITYLSDPEQEYDEIALKLSAQLKVLNGQFQF